jgi:monovalent cation:H+ antiporter-2, CPA2 family
VHELDLILTLTVSLTAALALGYFTQRIHLSPIVGYLLAGVLVGPFTPGFVAHKALADQLAEIGVVLLMFGVGLSFHARDLLAVRKVAIPGAIVQIAVATLLGSLVGRAAGWSLAASIVFGLALSVASTVVLMRVLSDAQMLHTATGRLAVGWLVLEDIFTVIVLVLLPAMATDGDRPAVQDVAVALAVGLGKLGALVALTALIGSHLLPALLAFVARTRSRELFTLTVLVVALGVALVSALVFGASMALGAFLAGMVIAQSAFSARAASDALPLRDAFAVLFFVSIGMLLDPATLLANWRVIAASTAVVVIGKPLVSILVVLALRRPALTAAAVGLALGQVGEFSFILAALAQRLGVLPGEAAQVVVATSILSITMNPLLFEARGTLARWLPSRSSGGRRPFAGGADPSRPDPDHTAIVVGYGHVGRLLTRLLSANGVVPTVIEMNLETVTSLEGEGVRVVYGDATRREILERAGIRSSRSLFVTAPGIATPALIQSAKELNPDVFVLARAIYMDDVTSLEGAGANRVVVGEAEVALAMSEQLLERLGATAEQLERERERVRIEVSSGGRTPDQGSPAVPH